MKTLIILAHPDPDSFNGRLAKLASTTMERLGGEVIVSDLYGEGFDPRESPEHFASRATSTRFDAQAEQRHAFEAGRLPVDVAREMERVLWADTVIFQFPLWWFGPPAILKGWLDRVLVYGGMYSSAMRHGTGRCQGKRALLGITTGSSAAACSFNGIEGETRLVVWPFIYALSYVGFAVLEPFILHDIHRPAGKQADDIGGPEPSRYAGMEESYVSLLEGLNDAQTISFNMAKDWDETGRLKPGAPAFSPFIRQKRDLEVT